MTRDEKRAVTRAELVAAAERLFVSQGFHATSVDAIADEAGYTKGAVYSNFATKEDLFFAVYDRRVRAGAADLEQRFGDEDFGAATERLAQDVAARRDADDGWLAVFFEFWSHVLRHPEHRERFAALHAEAIRPAAEALERHAAAAGTELPDEARKLATAWYAMQVGLSLERLTQPEVVDPELGARMMRLQWQDLDRGGSRG
jgi:AcrR family transcriptional regulator